MTSKKLYCIFTGENEHLIRRMEHEGRLPEGIRKAIYEEMTDEEYTVELLKRSPDTIDVKRNMWIQQT